MQDFASFAGTLLNNRAAREGAWSLIQSRWKDVEARAGGAPMLFRRVIEAMGSLPERSHYEQVAAFLAAHPVEAAKAAIAQTLERMKQDVELRERTLAPVGAWLRSR
jgi:puromycin-sensitive aminopeptidase